MTYHSFKLGYRLFEREPDEAVARTEFRTTNYHSSGEVYQPNFCARQLGCPQTIPIKFYKGCNRGTSWRDGDDVEIHQDCRCSVNKVNNSVNGLYPSWDPNAYSSIDFDTLWVKRFERVPAGGVLAEEFFNVWMLGLVRAKKGSQEINEKAGLRDQCSSN